MKANKIFYVFFIFVIGCTSDKFSVNVEEISHSKESFNLKLKTNISVISSDFSSRKIVCSNIEDIEKRVDGHIDKIEGNILYGDIEVCKNNDHELCEPMDIENYKINLKCHVLLSSMLGNVHKSNDFYVKLK